MMNNITYYFPDEFYRLATLCEAVPQEGTQQNIPSMKPKETPASSTAVAKAYTDTTATDSKDKELVLDKAVDKAIEIGTPIAKGIAKWGCSNFVTGNAMERAAKAKACEAKYK